MGIRAVRTENQDVISSVMRRVLIDRVLPLVSLDSKSNPLAGKTDDKKLSGLLEKFGNRVRDRLADLSSGEISILDFNRRMIKILDEICIDKDADGGFLREFDNIVHNIQMEMDGTVANVRRLMSMNGAHAELTPADAALLNLIKAARQQIASEQTATPPPAEHQKSLRIIRDSDGKPLKDHPEYGPMLEKFLQHRGLTEEDSPQIVKFFRILADKPLGQRVGKTVLRETFGISDGALNALINRVKRKKLYLNNGENPTTPGFFIRMAGREDRQRQDKQLGHYCYELVVAVEEK